MKEFYRWKMRKSFSGRLQAVRVTMVERGKRVAIKAGTGRAADLYAHASKGWTWWPKDEVDGYATEEEATTAYLNKKRDALERKKRELEKEEKALVDLMVDIAVRRYEVVK